MPSINFYLKEPQSQKATLIYLFYRYNNKTVKLSTGEFIEPKNWNNEKQRAKKNSETTLSKKFILNDFLDFLEKGSERIYNEELKHGKPTVKDIQTKLKYLINPVDKTQGKGLFELIDEFVQNHIYSNGKPKGASTIKNYKSTLNHLLNFQKKEKIKLTFESINLDFFHKFTNYLNTENLSTNTIAKYIKVIKTFMNEAVELGYTKNEEFKKKKFSIRSTPGESIYLTADEIITFYHYDFTKNPKLERTRDLFILGCFTGLRFSDYVNIKPENIVVDNDNHYIKIKTQKTGEPVIIPCHPIVLKIIDKYQKIYSSPIPPLVSNQKFNEYIKEAAKSAGFLEKGKLTSNLNAQLWECISSHTARRSFATNLYLQGFPSIEIMKITGHRTERAFLTYIKVSKLESAKRLKLHMKKHWEMQLIVAK